MFTGLRHTLFAMSIFGSAACLIYNRFLTSSVARIGMSYKVLSEPTREKKKIKVKFFLGRKEETLNDECSYISLSQDCEKTLLI